MSYPIRAATRADIPELRELIALSARELSQRDYRPEQIEGALRGAFCFSTSLRPLGRDLGPLGFEPRTKGL